MSGPTTHRPLVNKMLLTDFKSKLAVHIKNQHWFAYIPALFTKRLLGLPHLSSQCWVDCVLVFAASRRFVRFSIILIVRQKVVGRGVPVIPSNEEKQGQGVVSVTGGLRLLHLLAGQVV